jgi:hypothetical protein
MEDACDVRAFAGNVHRGSCKEAWQVQTLQMWSLEVGRRAKEYLRVRQPLTNEGGVKLVPYVDLAFVCQVQVEHVQA